MTNREIVSAAEHTVFQPNNAMSGKRRINEDDFPEPLPDEGMELGPRTDGQRNVFQKMREAVTPGQIHLSTYDVILKKRHKINYETELPRAVSPDQFDADLLKIQQMSAQEGEIFDDGVMMMRGERRDKESRGTYTYRDSFGSNVFGFAYHLPSGTWSMTNEFGLHSACAEMLTIEFDCGLSDILSGTILQLESIQTPIIGFYGFANCNPEMVRKAMVDIWSWKTIIPLTDFGERKNYSEICTPELLERIIREFWK